MPDGHNRWAEQREELGDAELLEATTGGVDACTQLGRTGHVHAPRRARLLHRRIAKAARPLGARAYAILLGELTKASAHDAGIVHKGLGADQRLCT